MHFLGISQINSVHLCIIQIRISFKCHKVHRIPKKMGGKTSWQSNMKLLIHPYRTRWNNNSIEINT